jgi:amino acid transporter
LGIAKVTESMQLCAYNLTINYYMVKLTNHKKAIDRPLSCKRWGIIAIIIFFAGSLSFLLYSYFSHDVDNPQCSCLLCMLNHVPEEGEYIYNRYLIFISFIWIAVIFAAVFLVNYCFVKKNKKK